MVRSSILAALLAGCTVSNPLYMELPDGEAPHDLRVPDLSVPPSGDMPPELPLPSRTGADSPTRL